MGNHDDTKFIVAAVAVALFLGALAMAAATWAILLRSQPKNPKMRASGSILGASTDYKPSSAWIEDGLDPNVTTFDMSAPSKGRAAPELRDIDGEIYNAVSAHQNDLMPCYATVLQDEDVQGKVDMRFGIAADGHVALVKVTKSSLASKKAEDCFVKIARTWTFPKTGRTSLTQFDTDFGFYYD